jgi:predicted nucleotidyltransferase
MGEPGVNVDQRLRVIAEHLRREYGAEKILLYGSCARGEAGPDSDMDLLIIAPSRERFFERMASVLRLSRDLRAGLPLSPVVLTPEEVEQRLARGDQFVADILSSGVEIQ